MVAVHIESSSESLGGVRGSSAMGDGERSASSSSVSPSFLEETVRSSGREPGIPDAAGDQIFHGVPIFLLKGGLRIDGSPYEPDAYGDRELLEWRVNRTHVVRDVEDSRLVRAGVSLRNERVYYGKRSSPDDFFYMYANVFTQLFVRVPFTEFQMAVLREANVAPAQLHPNSWAAVQAFLAMCLAVGVTPTIPVFFHYFEVRPPTQGGWVSLTSVRDMTLFRPFSDSFKNFKHHYFKVIIDEAGRREFHDSTGNLRTINALPRRISARHLVECLRYEDCERKASHDDSCSSSIHFYGLPEARRRQLVLHPGEGGPNAPLPPLVRRSSSTGRLPPVTLVRPQSCPPVKVTRGSVPVVWAPGADPLPDLAVITVDPSSEAATASVAPFVRNRKDSAGEGHKDKEASSSRSASKKARKGNEKVPSAPLPGRIFSPAFNMSDRTKFHMSSSQRALIEPLSESELTNAMLEMSIRAASLAWYLKEFADRRGVDDVRTELLAEKKNSASLQSAMEQMILTHDDYDKRIETLEADLEKARRESADGSDRLAVARGDHERLLEECGQLKAKVARQRNSEHEEGFNKALRQASVLAGIHEPFALGFNIEKDVFDGVLVDLNTLADDEGPKTEGPSGAAWADQALVVEDDEEADDCDN
ncbi:hypothetical protein LR48_Vigan05g119900 [Vigna angularis]|uniref:Transposase (putative) gypsy type domain-containing protein n=1 Tax=Phaseolus angularis TaxID=3914 RepID=A0A0L9UM29_PHAAN|nr:hypothetical protein LR48_Vigan05g119900 [Vigna angularis]